MARDFILTALTADPELASRCDESGVDRIGVDIERLGKAERQPGAGHRISDHELNQLATLRPRVTRATLFARLNPLHKESPAETDQAIAGGAGVLMLPYFKTAGEVESFVRQVDGRATVALLLESITAVSRLHEILAVAGIDEVMVGLNDLSLSCGLSHSFEFLACDLMDHVAETVHAAGLPFGFGGLGRAFDDSLPVPSDLIIAQHARLGSTAAWLSRSFFGREPDAIDVSTEVKALRERLRFWEAQPAGALLAQRDALRARVGVLRGDQ